MSDSKPSWHVSILAIVTAAAIFSADLSVPLGVAAGVPYVTVVLIAMWSPRRRDILIFASLCSALTLVGYTLSASGGEAWKVATNRVVAVYAICVVAALGYVLRRRSEEAIRTSQAKADRLADVQDKNPDSVMHVAKDGTLLYANLASQPLCALWNVLVGQRLPDPWQERAAATLDSGPPGRVRDRVSGPRAVATVYAGIGLIARCSRGARHYGTAARGRGVGITEVRAGRTFDRGDN